MKKIIFFILLLLIIIQFFTIDKTNPPSDKNADFINLTSPPTEISTLLKNSCYDCHSYHTKYPWYSNIAPVSWILKSHINDGRKHVNFSEWRQITNNKKDHALEEIVEVLNSGEMPLTGYAVLHPEADLSIEQRDKMINWVNSIRVLYKK